MKMKLLLSAIMLIVGHCISCKKNNLEIPLAPKEPDIYMSGKDSFSRTVYWINGKIYGTRAGNEPGSMIVSGGDVYFLNANGYQKNNLQIKNTFSGGGFTDMAVSGEDVYLVGYSDVNDTVPFYWKNGQKVKIESALPRVRYITVSENSVYLAGNIYGNMTPQLYYWGKDKFSIIDKGSANKIKVDGDDIYILGQDENLKGCYWKNGIKHQLYSTNNTIVDLRDIYIKDKDVYVVGYSDDPIPAYWKNDEPMGKDLYTGVIFSSIAVHNSDVYLVGNYRAISGRISAFVWKNGVIDTIGTGTVINKIIVK